MYLYINKLKQELYTINTNIKLKLNYLMTLYEIKINQIKQQNINYSIEYINSIHIKSSNNVSYNPKDKHALHLIIKENERLKKELAILIKDINEQQNEISNLKKEKHDFESLNKNLFSVSDYMKYSLIYEFNNTKEILNVFNIMINNTKTIFDEDTNIFIEILRNFLIVIEKIKSNKKSKYDEELKEAFNIFVERCNYEINDLNENEVFMRILVIKLFEIAFFS